jgi:hypothetical protein
VRADQSNLFRDGINPLKDRGLIASERRKGYFRPDAPPPGKVDC